MKLDVVVYKVMRLEYTVISEADQSLLQEYSTVYNNSI